MRPRTWFAAFVLPWLLIFASQTIPSAFGAAEITIFEDVQGADLIDNASTVQVRPAFVGVPSTVQFFIFNEGDTTLTVSGITKDGANASEFIVSPLGTNSIAPGAFTTFTVRCTPTATGTRTAAIHIANNDANESPFDIALTGTGVAVPPQPLGPDSAGYTMTRNVPFQFVSIATTGTAILDNVDDEAAGVNIGFNFNFYGQAYSRVAISSNGLISFDENAGNNTAFSNLNLLSANFGAPVIAAFWDDWVTSASTTDKVYTRLTGTAGSRVFTVQWHVTPIGGGNEAVFQCQLLEATREVRLNYSTVNTGNSTSNAAFATIGIQDLNGNSSGRGLQWSFNTASIADGTSLLITPGTPPAPGEISLLSDSFEDEVLSDGESVIILSSNVGNTATQRFRIFNASDTADLVGLRAIVDGLDAEDFAVSDLTQTRLSPGTITSFTVSFSPRVLGSRVTFLRVFSNDPDNSPFDVILVGIGSAAPPQVLGPDSFGYTATRVPSAFVDIANSGQVIIDDDDDVSVAVDPGFPFSFYGTTYNSLRVTENGLISFGSPIDNFVNEDLQTKNAGAPVIAPMWDDWATFSSTVDKVVTATSGAAGNRIFTVQWNVTPFYAATEGRAEVAIFQCQIFEATGQIRFNYSDVQTGNSADRGGSATIGIQDAGGSQSGRVLQWSFNTASVNAGTSLLFSPPEPEIAVQQPVGTELTSGDTRDFGRLTVGTVGELTFTLSNSGLRPLTDLAITKTGPHAGDFVVTAPAASVAPNGSTTFTVRFTPSAAGARMASLQIASNDRDESPFTILLSGTGIVPDIAVDGVTNGGSHVFNTVVIGTSAQASFTLRNVGEGVLTGLAFTKTGPNSADFVVAGVNTTTLTTGERMTFTVNFAPSASGSRTATLQIASNDPDENPFTIALSGNGLQGSLVVVPANLQVFDGNSLESSGNRDREINRGETIALGIGLQNVGSMTATNVRGELSSPSAFVELVNVPAEEWIDIVPGATVPSRHNRLSFRVRDDAPAHPLPLTLTITTDQGTFSRDFFLPVVKTIQADLVFVSNFAFGGITGEDIYDYQGRPRQIAAEVVKKGQARTFFLEVQNDGIVPNTFRLNTAGVARKYKIKFTDDFGVDLTEQFLSQDGVRIDNLQVGERRRFKVRIRGAGNQTIESTFDEGLGSSRVVTRGAQLDFTFLVFSFNDNTIRDRLALRVRSTARDLVRPLTAAEARLNQRIEQAQKNKAQFEAKRALDVEAGSVGNRSQTHGIDRGNMMYSGKPDAIRTDSSR